jgi:hypothetical protein
LVRVRDFLIDATEVVDQHRTRIHRIDGGDHPVV